jgi:hypothetical protein
MSWYKNGGQRFQYVNEGELVGSECAQFEYESPPPSHYLFIYFNRCTPFSPICVIFNLTKNKKSHSALYTVNILKRHFF